MRKEREGKGRLAMLQPTHLPSDSNAPTHSIATCVYLSVCLYQLIEHCLF